MSSGGSGVISTSYSTNLSVSWEVDLWGKAAPATEANQASLHQRRRPRRGAPQPAVATGAELPATGGDGRTDPPAQRHGDGLSVR